MAEYKIGYLLGTVRKQKGIGRAKLCRGICSEAMLSRLESGEYLVDFMTFERLFSRLGKSVNRINSMLSEEDYKMLEIKRFVETALVCKNNQAVESRLSEYGKQMKKTLQQQYLFKIKAFLEQQKGETQKACEDLKTALQMTLPDFCLENIEDYLLGEEEYELLFMWLEAVGYQEKQNEQVYLKILHYLQHQQMDEEMWVSLWPKAVCVCGKILIKYGKYKEVENLAEEAKALLQKNAIFLYVPQLIELQIKSREMAGDSISMEKFLKQRKIWQWVYESSGYSYPIEEAGIFWERFRMREVNLFSEKIREQRLYEGKTQEELAELIEMDQKTISRLEAGVHTPKKNTFWRLKAGLGVDWEIYDTVLVTDDFRVLEEERDYNRMVSEHKYAEAEKMLEQIMGQVSLQYKRNKQYQMSERAWLDAVMGRCEIPDAINRLMDAFEVTRRFSLEEFSEAILGEKEATIAVRMAYLYRKLGKETMAIKILEAVVAGYDRSNVDELDHYKVLLAVLWPLACYCETSNRLEEAMCYCERMISLEIRCGRTIGLGSAIMQKIYICERMGKEKEWCKAEYKTVYQLFILLKGWQSKLALEKHYREIYGEKITQ